MIYKDKNTRHINLNHQSKIDDEYYFSDRRVNRKQEITIIKFRVTIPLIYRFWFDSLTQDDKLSVISLKHTSGCDRYSGAIKKITFEELMKMYTGDIAKIRELKLNYLSI
jgi:hypothetical protein